MSTLLQNWLVRDSIESLDLPNIRLKYQMQISINQCHNTFVINDKKILNKSIHCSWFNAADKSMMATSGESKVATSGELYNKHIAFGILVNLQTD